MNEKSIISLDLFCKTDDGDIKWGIFILNDLKFSLREKL